jgi:hypothetical protein
MGQPMNHPLATLFDQFLKERIYLKNVSPQTIVWYQVAFKNYPRYLRYDNQELLFSAFVADDSCAEFVVALRGFLYMGLVATPRLSVFCP